LQGVEVRRQFNEVESTIPTIFSYFSAPGGTLLWKGLENTFKESPIWWDHLLFPGSIVIITLFISILLFNKLYKNENKYYLIGFLFLFLFTISINNKTLYGLIFKLPGFNSMRALGRVINVELFFFSVFTVLTLKYFYNKLRYKTAFILIATVLIILDQAIISKPSWNFNKSESQNRINELENQITNNTNKTCFAYCPTNKTDPFPFYNIDAMLLSQTINLPTINGYSATCPIQTLCNFITGLDTTDLYEWSKYNNLNKENILILH
jgi:hypothetical protein